MNKRVFFVVWTCVGCANLEARALRAMSTYPETVTARLHFMDKSASRDITLSPEEFGVAFVELTTKIIDKIEIFDAQGEVLNSAPVLPIDLMLVRFCANHSLELLRSGLTIVDAQRKRFMNRTPPERRSLKVINEAAESITVRLKFATTNKSHDTVVGAGKGANINLGTKFLKKIEILDSQGKLLKSTAVTRKDDILVLRFHADTSLEFSKQYLTLVE